MRSKKLSLVLLLSVSMSNIYAEFPPSRLGPRDERKVAYDARRKAAFQQTMAQDPGDIEHDNNGDEVDVPNFAAMFTKIFEHNAVDGTVTPNGSASYQQLVKAMSTGHQADFNAINFNAGSPRKLVNPQAGLAMTMNGMDSSLFVMALPPKLTSAEMAADMIETYLNMVCRDVSFSDYGTGLNTDVDPVYGGSLTAHAAAILNDLGGAYLGPRNGGIVDVSVLFRGQAPGCLVGPYVSQFSLLPLYPLFVAGCVGSTAGQTGVPNLPISAFQVLQTYPIPAAREFGVSWPDFVAIQNGLYPKIYDSTDYYINKRYPITGRDLGSYVHRDGPYESYYYALNILATRGFPICPVFPYANGSITREGAGLTMAPPDAFGLLGTVALAAFRAAWAQKWRCNRRIRPEAMAGLVHYAKVNNVNPYNLDASLFSLHAGYDYLALVLAHNQLQASIPNNPIPLPDASTYLLAQMYPEGSPEHPAYPSGHATGAGACVTILKAIMKEDELIINHVQPVKVNPADPTQLIPLTNGEGANLLTVGGELNKIAFSISMARDFAGVHYRSDAWNGMLLGEAVAISVLQDHSRIYMEEGFTGFEFTKFDGHKIRVTPDQVIVLS